MLEEDLPGFEAQPSDLGLEQLGVLATVLEQLADYAVHVHLFGDHIKWKTINI